MPTSWDTFCDPAVGQTLRSDGTTGGLDAGVITGNCSAILGGILSATPTNSVGADLSVILMGDTNVINTFGAANGTYNLIGNGCQNVAAGHWAAIVNGEQNRICGHFDAVVNGICNCIIDVDYSTIAGGARNCIVGGGSIFPHYSFIGGGCANLTQNIFGTVAGGGGNNAVGEYSFVGGGQNNNAFSNFAFAGGGKDNTSFGLGAAVVGGCLNANGDNFSFIGGGCCNLMHITSCHSVIGGGGSNTIGCAVIPHSNSRGACFSFIGGGQSNCIDSLLGGLSCYNTIAGGFENYTGISTCFTSVFGGCRNRASGGWITMGGGQQNTAGAAHASIFGGTLNLTEGIASFIGGGNSNCIRVNIVSPDCSSIVGGGGNQICGDADFAVIAGGSNNRVTGFGSALGGGVANHLDSPFSFLGGGEQNCIEPGGIHNTLGGGSTNMINSAALTPSNRNTIGGGANNIIASGINNASIFGGQGNQVSAHAAFLGGGDANRIESNFGLPNCSAIVGGTENRITDNGAIPAELSFIGGGHVNNIFGVCSAIVAGHLNTVWANNSIIGAGNEHTIFGGAVSSGIFSGDSNCVMQDSFTSFIGGGHTNCIGNATASFLGARGGTIAGGGFNIIDTDNANATTYGFIGGGECNCLCPGGNHSTVAGGFQNCLAGTASFIGGGFNNCLIGDDGNTISGGRQNQIVPPVNVGVLNFNTIGGGRENIITRFDNANHNGIFSGFQNYICEFHHSFIGGGRQNCINMSGESFIGGGQENEIWGGNNTIGGGNQNMIGDATATPNQAYFSFIGGGVQNCMDSVGGDVNYAAIGGGQNNCIGPATDHSSIFSGKDNIVTGSCSSILGGDNNNDGGNPFTGIYGTGVNGLALVGGNGGFFVNELVIQNIPVVPNAIVFATMQPGQVYTTGAPGSPYLGRPLYIA